MSDFTRPLAERYFEDYVVGIDVTYGAEPVTEDAIVAFAADYDRQRIHTDPAFAASGPFGGLIASGWQTAAITMRVFTTYYLNEAASLASPGIDELRWTKPVRPDDVLSVRFVVTAARASSSKPDRGLVTTALTTLDAHGETVMTMSGVNFLRRREG